jgi:toxin ParE1/3/4
MSLPIRFLPEARAEFDAATDWYERQRTGLEVDFVAEVRAVRNRIAVNPRIHGTIHGDVRKAVVRRFPYLILDREGVGEVVVIAVFPTSRDPSVWQTRA